MNIAIIGGGIAGLALALNLNRRGLKAEVYEAAREMKELGVGITLLPHGMRELTELGLQEKLLLAGIETRESAFFNRFGQLIYKEARGRFAGYSVPEVGIHRGRLHRILFDAAREEVGAERIHNDRRFVGLEQDAGGVTLAFEEGSSNRRLEPVHADIVIACDGVNSTVRRQFYPDESVVFHGINTWRGATRHKPILDGRTYMRIGSLRTGKIVVYPIVDDIDADGNQLINWTTEIEREGTAQNDWNKPGRIEDFMPVYQDWVFDWLSVPDLIARSEVVLEYPMVDKDPIDRWTFGRVTFAGDAAHPMYPRGSTGSSQALIDVRILADHLARMKDPQAALEQYQADRLSVTTKVVQTNRANPPDYINIKVEELTGDKPFTDLDAYITQAELKEMSDSYKQIAGYDLRKIG